MKILTFNRKKSIILIVLVIIAVSVVIFNTYRNPKAISGKIKTLQQDTTISQGKSSVTQPKSVSIKGSHQDTSISSNASNADTSAPLIAPYGALVSNHRPGQNGGNAIEQSECITTPGAICIIQFTQNGVTKTLADQTTDSTGTTIWTWDANKAGLTSGDWQITATAKLGSQIKSTIDKLSLEIK